jgi:hypothetical protein
MPQQDLGYHAGRCGRPYGYYAYFGIDNMYKQFTLSILFFIASACVGALSKDVGALIVVPVIIWVGVSLYLVIDKILERFFLK